MYYLIISLFVVSSLSLLITFFSFSHKMSSIEIVNDMGIGWNMANSFDCYDDKIEIKTPDDQLKLWGGRIPSKEIFSNIKKYGIKTIRVPITWKFFIDEVGNVHPDWMTRVKEVVNLITKQDFYCIINIHYDGIIGYWLNEGIKVKDKFLNLWSQIANEFKNYDQHLIFESMNDIEYKSNDNFNYLDLLSLTQSFVDVVRNSGGKNGDRLLIISGANKNFDLTCSTEYKLPIDPSNKIAISIHYYNPDKFALEPDDEYWTWIDDSGNIIPLESLTKWGTENDYKDMFLDFDTMKKTFVDKGIPVIVTEIGVVTEQKKEKESIREFLYFEFLMSSISNGIMSCLYDNSNKESPNKRTMNYYDRYNDKWYDEKIGQFFLNISKGNFIKPTDYFLYSNKETVTTPNSEGHMNIKIGTRKAMKVIFNVNIIAKYLWDVGFGVCTLNTNGVFSYIQFDGTGGKKKYDGSYTFTADISKLDYNSYVQVQRFWGKENVTFNYLTVEYDKEYTLFDYNAYKSSVQSNYININNIFFCIFFILVFL